MTTSLAQNKNGRVIGTIIDSISGEALTRATASLVKEKDSSIFASTVSDIRGNFEIKNLDNATYTLVVSFQGLETIKKTLAISAYKNVVDLGSLKLKKAYKILQEVIVKDLVPIKVNGDTLAYNVDAFKTKPDATVEDLLKKLPGLRVDKNGSVKAQGEEVQKVYVDGKEFFSNDPKLATKNLTADMIDQVQVYNDLSEQAKFSGIDDGSRTKAINLKLKKDKKTGVIGKAYAGYGTDSRYIAGINSNYFKGASQVSVIAASNNINNSGYTLANMLGMTASGKRGFGGMSSGGNGITKTGSIGLNYRDTWSESFDVNGSYFFNQANTTNLRKSLKQTFLTDSTLSTYRNTIYNNINDNHRLNLNIIYTIDSFNSIIYTPNFNLQNSRISNIDTLTDFVNKRGINYKADDSRTVNNSSDQSSNWANNLIWRRKFNKPGRTFSVNFSNVFIKGDRTNYNINNSRFYDSSVLLYSQRNTDYKISSNNETHNYGVMFAYTEPLSVNKFIEVNYSYRNNKNASDRKTYNYNGTTHTYEGLVDTLTNKFENTNKLNRFGTNFKGVNKKYTYQLGFAVQQTLLENNDLSKNSNLSQRYINLFPTALFTYQIGKNKNVQINYRGNNNVPFITQLQDITDVTNYPYIRKGNPNLHQEFVNTFMFTYNSFNISTLQNLFINVIYSSTHNKIVSSIQQKAGEQITMPVNLDGVYYASGSLNFGLPIQKMAGGSFNTTTHLDYSRNASMINNSKNFANDLAIGQDISLNYSYDDKLDVGINASVTYNAVNYTIQQEHNNSYFVHNYSLDATYTLPAGFILSTEANYNAISRRTDGFGKNYIIWNASVSKKLFKNKRGDLRLSIIDILNQNINISRSVGENYIEDVQNNTLKRFGLLTFTYNLNKFGGGKNFFRKN